MSDAVEEIRACERRVISAILNRDLVTIDAVIAPEFVYTASEIGRRTRQDWLEGIGSYRLDIFEIVE
ncbi:MAG: nuclear transport factor 2 family protein, partial [Thermomicrobiales bacterium]